MFVGLLGFTAVAAQGKRLCQDSLAEWSKALAPGASPQGRGLEPHSCQHPGRIIRKLPLWVFFHGVKPLQVLGSITPAREEPKTHASGMVGDRICPEIHCRNAFEYPGSVYLILERNTLVEAPTLFFFPKMSNHAILARSLAF